MQRALFGIAAVSLGAGCFYTDGINEAPTAEIRQTNETEPLYANGEIRLAADGTDPDGDLLTFAWSAQFCAAECDEFQSRAANANPLFTVNIPEDPPQDTITVRLAVLDKHGAAATDDRTFTILNQAPAVSVQVQPSGNRTVGRPLTVIASATDEDTDVDSLTLTWTPFPAAGSDPKVREWEQITGAQCPPASNPEDIKRECYHLRPDVDGLWNVQVEVSDGEATDEITTPILVDPDMPPCIATTTPELVPGATYILERADEVRRFAALSVTDELDPYPLPPSDNDPDRGEATFRWWLASPDTSGLRVEIDHSLADYYLDPSLYAPGDQIELRVEASDRVSRALPCADDTPTCSIGDDGCLQRVSWAVEIR